MITWAGVSRPRVRVAFWTVVLCALPWFGTKTVAVALGRIVPAWVNAILLLTSGICMVSAALSRKATWVYRVVQITETLFSLLAWSGFLLLGEVLWFFFGARHLNTENSRATTNMSRPFRSTNAAKPRVIWIILDELSYEQTFENRALLLTLPAFDTLRSQSVLFTRVIPAGFRTERVIPALITGLPIEHISSSTDGEKLSLIGPAGQVTLFDPHKTIFADALRAGYSVGVVGWYNPYCRLLAGVLDRCLWVPHHDTLPGGFRTDAVLARNLAAPVLSGVRSLGRLISPQSTSTWNDRAASDEHIAEYRDLATDADSMLADKSITFLFLHMAVPHPEGIYNRHQAEITDNGRSSYIDNLALADRFLQHVEDGMRERGEWDSAVLVVMGDHSWRTRELWRRLPGWNSEDEEASHGGQFDPRPAYIIKLPGETNAAQIDVPFDALWTRALLDTILMGEVRSERELRNWALGHASKKE